MSVTLKVQSPLCVTCLVDVSVRRGTVPSTPGLVKDVLTECTCWTEYAFVSYISRVYLSDIMH